MIGPYHSTGLTPTALRELFCKRVCDFNRLTRQELGEATFSCACRPIE